MGRGGCGERDAHGEGRVCGEGSHGEGRVWGEGCGWGGEGHVWERMHGEEDLC